MAHGTGTQLTSPGGVTAGSPAFEVDVDLIENAVRLERFRGNEPDDPAAGGRAGGGDAARRFEQLGFGDALRGLLAERPTIRRAVGRVIVHGARRRSEEGADLFRPEGESAPVLVERLCPETFVTPGRLPALLRRELLYVADMLNPAFGYDPAAADRDLPPSDAPPRERYMALWALSVEQRLLDEGHGDAGRVALAEATIARAFPHLTAADQGDLLAAVRRGITHERLVLLVRGAAAT